MSTLGNIFSALKSAGLTGSALNSTFQSIVGSAPGPAVKAACSTIIANSSNPSVVADEAKDIAEIANLPDGVRALLPALTAPNVTPAQVIQTALQIEQVASGD